MKDEKGMTNPQTRRLVIRIRGRKTPGSSGIFARFRFSFPLLSFSLVVCCKAIELACVAGRVQLGWARGREVAARTK